MKSPIQFADSMYQPPAHHPLTFHGRIDRLFIWLSFGTVAGITAFLHGFFLMQRKRLIENIPTSRVRSVAMGLAEVKGKAKVYEKLFESPFSRKQSVYFRYKIEAKKGEEWVTIANYETPDFFYLEDETGRILVNPKGADLHLERSYTFRTHLGTSPEEKQFKEGLRRLGIGYETLFGFERTLRCEEKFIEPEDPIYVLGTTMNNPYTAGSDRDRILLAKDRGTYFCISDKSEKELLSSMGWKMALCLYGGPVLTVTCLFFLIMLYFS